MITYNHEKFIAQAMESVLMQKTGFPFELVIGEDCSTDGTADIVRRYSRQYPGIIRAYIQERNLGSKENSRLVRLAARGEYWTLLEGDDYWTDSGRLQRLADVLDAHPETVLCGHRTIRRHEDGSRPDEVMYDAPAGVYDLEALLTKPFLHTSSVMFRPVVKGPPEWSHHLLMGDDPWFMELARHGDICLLDDSMAVYRIHGGGIWSGLNVIEQTRASLAARRVFYEHVEPQYRSAVRIGMRNAVRALGFAQFDAGRPDQTRQCLREYCGLCGPLEFLPDKGLLALKGYGWWMFPLWRQARRLWRRG